MTLIGTPCVCAPRRPKMGARNQREWRGNHSPPWGWKRGRTRQQRASAVSLGRPRPDSRLRVVSFRLRAPPVRAPLRPVRRGRPRPLRHEKRTCERGVEYIPHTVAHRRSASGGVGRADPSRAVPARDLCRSKYTARTADVKANGLVSLDSGEVTRAAARWRQRQRGRQQSARCGRTRKCYGTLKVPARISAANVSMARSHCSTGDRWCWRRSCAGRLLPV